MSLSFKLFTSFWCPCTIFPHFVIEPGPEACIKTGKSQLFSRFELSIFNILPWTNLGALSLLMIGFFISLHSPPPPRGKKLLKCPTQLFRRRQNRRPWLSTRRLNRRLALRFKFPTPARQRFKFPSLAPGHRRRSNVSGFPVRCWDGGLSLTVFSSVRAHDCR